MRSHRLFLQVFVAYLVATIISVILVVGHALRSEREFYLDHLGADLHARCVLLREWVAGPAGFLDTDTIDRTCKRLGQATDARLTVVRHDGVVLGDSERDPAEMDNHADRPEMAAAMQTGTGRSIRYSDTLRQSMMYVGYRIDGVKPGAGVIRVSLSLSAIDAALRTNAMRISLMATAIAMLVLIIGWILSRRICDPLETIKQGAESLADGNLETRIHVVGSYEMVSLAESFNRMADEIQRRMNAQQAQRNEREAVFSSMAEGVIAVDLDERIIHMNPAAARLFDAPRDTVRGRAIQEVVRNRDLQVFARECVKSSDPVETEINLPTAVGKDTMHLQAHGTVLRDAGGHRMGALIVLNDVTRLRRLENVRKDFVANVTHELKTPITTIRGFVETLRDGAAEQKAQRDKFLEIIERQVIRLEALISDLLLLARLEHDDSTPDITRDHQTVQPILNDAIELADSRAARKEIRLTLDCAEDLEADLNASLVEQAVLNLVDNAINHSDPGSEVTIRACRSEDDLIVTVQDRGKGIESAHLARLFERFYRVDPGRSRQMGGTGLGLSIVRHVALLHGGTVDVESALGLGSTFTIRIPASKR